MKQWSLQRVNPLEILTERENIYKLLSQTTDGPSSQLKDGHKSYTLNPNTRYRTVPKKIDHEKILELYDTDAPEELDFLREKFVGKQYFDTKEHRTLLQRLRKGVQKKKDAVAKKLKRQPTQQQQQQPVAVGS